MRGEDGVSAYEIALDGGFVGTQNEWVDSLQGPEGPEGPAGLPGLDGEDWDENDDFSFDGGIY
ncbi:MAG: hypothetical protein AB8E87_13675 [Prochlorococcus sp.]|nr:hypothetical protein [Prochlorococcaceae cyanobacterium Fu_MAG_50]